MNYRRAFVFTSACALLLGCANDPPAPEPAPIPAPAATPAVAPTPRAAPPAQAQATPTPAAPAKRPTATVRISGGSFGSEVRRFRKGDLIEIEMSRGRYLRGSIETLDGGQLIIKQEPKPRSGASRVRLRPGHVREIALLYRPVQVEGSSGAAARGPLTPEQSWLEEHAPDEVLGKLPHVLWNTRFLHNVPLVVARPLTLNGLELIARQNARSYFSAGSLPQALYAGDEVKLIGAYVGHQRAPRGVPEPSLGRVYGYLVRRADTIWPVFSLDRLHPSDLQDESVARYLEHEPMTLIVSRPGEPPLSVVRKKASELRGYRQRLDAIPEPQAMRRLRAKDDPSLTEIETEIRAVYALFGLEGPDLEHRISVQFELPAAIEGNLRLLRYEREVGLD